MPNNKPSTIDGYIAGFPRDVQTILEQIRTAIKTLAPDAAETISYGIPSFTRNGGYLIYFAAFKHHVSIYPAPAGSEAFNKTLAAYKKGKGTVQFPFSKPLPIAFISSLIKYRIKENRLQAQQKKK
jgi:uncharacterized protein YdhG (YjbR/CyaY superfamily)